jgi:hypothetical protein
MDLFALAGQNAPLLLVRFEELLGRLEDSERERLQRFTEGVNANGLLSINLRPSVLVELIWGQKHQNIYDWAVETAGISGRSEVELLKERLGSYYDKRMAFDTAFIHGQHFRYGALNIGGAGATQYGTFCLVLSSAYVTNCGLVAYVRGDSLHTYIDASGSLQEDAIKADVASPLSCHHLAALKHNSDVQVAPEEEWATVLLSETSFVEGILACEFQLNDVDEVRIREQDKAEFWDLTFNQFRKKKDDAEHALQSDYKTIFKAAAEGVLKLQEC